MLKRNLAKALFATLTAAMILASPVSAAVKEPTMQIKTMSETMDVDDVGEMEQTQEELFAGYVDKEFGIQLFSDEPVVEKGLGYRKLTGHNLTIYRQLRNVVADIADGKRESTQVVIQTTGISYALTDLGVSGFDDPNFNDKFNRAFSEDIDTSSIFDYLLIDCPYDLYWFNKTATGAFRTTYSLSSDRINVTVPKITFSFTPAAAYAGTGEYTVDINKTGATQTAVNNATTIVNEAKTVNDYEKLKYYKEQICDLTSYNHAAADNEDTPYGDPWQLIYVFDGDTSTNVVCEGYSKAFQYLCDKTTFTSNIESSIVTGVMTGGTGAGRHMWNITKMNDGKNYLVDVTNCDTGTIGAPDKLFLVGASGTVSGGYTCTTGSSSITYTYDSKLSNTYTTAELTLANVNYDPANAPCMHLNSTVVGKVEATCTTEGYTGDTLCSDCGEEYIIGKAIPAKGHSWDEGSVTKEASCTETGIETYKCTVCNESKTETLAKVAHTAVVDPAVEATCTEAGKTAGKHCSVCNTIIVPQQVISALGHDWGSGVITKAPSYTENGVKTYTCNRCKATRTESIPKLEAVKVASIKLTGISNKIAAGRKIQLTATILPANATNKAVTWNTSNKAYATVSSKGLVTINKKAGGKTVVITAEAQDGSGLKAIYKISCMKGIVKKVKISGLKTVKAGKAIKLTAKVTATKGANKKIKWTSSNTKYATVSSTGKVVAKAAGKGKSVKITAAATDGSGKKSVVTIKIK